jgi:hypothetical protein
MAKQGWGATYTNVNTAQTAIHNAGRASNRLIVTSLPKRATTEGIRSERTAVLPTAKNGV